MEYRFSPTVDSLNDEATQTIELTELFTRDMTTTDSFDVRSEIWKTTFGKVIQSLPIPALLIDQSCHIVVTNEAWGKICPKNEKVKGLLLSRLFTDASIAGKVQSLLEEVFATRKPVVARGTLDMGDSMIWARMTFRAIRIMEERFVLLLAEDLTAEKQIVEETRKHREELEKRVEERTAELVAANARLKEEIAERKRMEMALRTSEERYRILSENSLIGIFVHQDGKLAYINRRAAEGLGYSEYELIGKSFLELVAPEDREMVKSIVAARLQGKPAPLQYQVRVATRNGEIKWVEARTAEIEQNGRSAILGTIIDITERKRAEEALRRAHDELEERVKESTSELRKTNEQLKREIAERKEAEEALRESEEKHRSVVENMQDIFYRTDTEGNIILASPSGARMLGFETVNQVIGMNVARDFYKDPAERDRLLALIQEKGSVQNFEVELLRRDGSTVTVSSNSHIYFDKSGQPLGVEGILTDITRRKKAEQALRESEEWHRSLVENSFDGIFVQQEGKIIFANSPLYQMLDYPPGELEGMEHWRIYYGNYQQITRERGEARMRGEDMPPQYEVMLQRKDGSFFEAEVSAKVINLKERPAVQAWVKDISERKQAEEALRLSEEKYRLLVDKAPIGIVSVDTEGRVLKVNQKLVDMLGSPSADATKAINVLSFELLLESGISGVFSKCLEQGADQSVEVPYTSKWGKTVYLRSIMTPLFGENSNVIGCQAVMEDVSERKQVEKALRESEERLDLALKGGDLAMWDYNIQTGEAAFNARRAEMVGYSLEEAEPDLTWWGKQVHPEDVDRVIEAFSAHARGLLPSYECEHRLRHRSGEYIWVLARAKIVERDEKGNPVRIVGTSLDITQRKRAEQALLSAHNALENRVEARTAELKRSEERYRALFEESLDAVFITTRNGRLVDANQAFLDLFGLTGDDAKEMDILDIYFDPADRERFQKAIEQSGSLKEFEVTYKKKDGSAVEGLLSSSLRLDKDGNILGYQGIIRDVTDRRLLQMQLLQAQKMEAIGTLAGGIAHDFNNLLQVTMGYSEVLLSKKEKTDPECGHLQQINQAGHSGAELVQRLLTLSRKTESKQRPTDLNHQIEQVRELLNRTIPKMIEIELHLDEFLSWVNADPIQVEQIIMNLAINARDAMPEGGKLTLATENVTLDGDYCRMHPGAKPGNYVLLTISDTGFGMDKEILDHIFEPFFTTKGVGSGSGLGLAVVYGIVQQHCGIVSCDSQPGHGTVFKVYLPAIGQQEIASDELAEASKFPGGTETILLVDDEDVVRNLGELILSESGYKVLTARNGKEALEIYQRKRDSVALVILDMLMPEMGGKQCIQELFKINPAVRVLVASGYASGGAARHAVELGAKAFVNKPFSVAQLLQQVRTVLDRGI